MQRTILLLILSLLVIFTFQGLAQTVDEVVKKNIEARGGYEKLKSINTAKITGQVIVQGMEMSFTLIQKRPHYIRLEGTMQGQTIVQAYDGETAWWIMPFSGNLEPHPMPEEEAKDILDMSDFDGYLVDYKDKGHSVDLLGKEDMEGTEVFKLKVTLKNGDIQHFYLDSEHFIELKVSQKRTRGGTEYEEETYYSDYKEVNGLMIPHAIESKAEGNVITQIKLETFEFNMEVDDSIFKMPLKEEKEE